MFSLSYLWAEVRRRKGRTILTALGFGVGTDLSVTRPIDSAVAGAAPRVVKLRDGVIISS